MRRADGLVRRARALGLGRPRASVKMARMSDVLVILCTCPDADTARTLARGLVERRLAACVNVLPEIRSIYRWQDGIEEEGECLMVVKTTGERYPDLTRWIEREHPYEVPEIVALRAGPVAEPYLEWLCDSVSRQPTEAIP